MIVVAVPFWWLIVMCLPSSYCDSGAIACFVDTIRNVPVSPSHCFYSYFFNLLEKQMQSAIDFWLAQHTAY